GPRQHFFYDARHSRANRCPTALQAGMRRNSLKYPHKLTPGTAWTVSRPSKTHYVNPDLELSQFDYELPQELIAQSPAAHRTGSRLLHLDRQSRLHDRQFVDLPQL